MKIKKIQFTKNLIAQIESTILNKNNELIHIYCIVLFLTILKYITLFWNFQIFFGFFRNYYLSHQIKKSKPL